ncbi:hypothetical protein SAPIO_CDS7476 [Scedosporium apiospermum]|uniref:Uncharacterized protein n=1 Tax=Pseudallescheria apiosperma TaxID=563466 RepID=A0A084G200_PSEDA|nr:uncharacterized protein SAPIO_CDS7476 [Scedosporium apiospermum]KEZ41362.1 hypothetical protein SAPIO_CDS7476 [Scedosporium apiospermum]
MASTSPFADLPPIKIGKGGGIGRLKAILGITPNSGQLSSLDVVIISIDLELPGQDRWDMHKFKTEGCGIAILDTRDLRDSSPRKSLNDLITTQEFSTKYPVKAKRLIPGRRCIFAPTNRIGQDQFRSVIAKALQVKDQDYPPTGRHARLRNIVLELYLYNAGNDATYTLVAMIKLVVKGSSSMNRLLKRKEEANIERLENLVFTDATPKVDDHGNPQEEPPR